MNYINLMDSIKEFEDLYKNINQAQDKNVYLKEHAFRESTDKVNTLLRQMFANNSNCEMLCINFIEKVNSLAILNNSDQAAALALFNSYEVLLATIFLLYKEERFEEIRRLVFRNPVCRSASNGESTSYNELFNLNYISCKLAECYLNKKGVCDEEIAQFLDFKVKGNTLSLEDFYFAEALFVNLLAIEYKSFCPIFSCGNCDELKNIKSKIKNIDNHLYLLKLFGVEDKDALTKKNDWQNALLNYLKCANKSIFD